MSDEQDIDASNQMVSEGCPNFLSEEEEIAEYWRERFEKLREWLRERYPTEIDFHVSLAFFNDELSSADLAFDCVRETAWRRAWREVHAIRDEVKADPKLQASMPSPWREWYFGKA